MHPSTTKKHSKDICGKVWQSRMAKHVNEVSERNRNRLNTSPTSGKDSQRLTELISPHKRLRERAGLWMFAKHSKFVEEPKTMTLSARRTIQKDLQEVMAEDSLNRRQMWNKAPPEPVNNDAQDTQAQTSSSIPELDRISHIRTWTDSLDRSTCSHSKEVEFTYLKSPTAETKDSGDDEGSEDGDYLLPDEPPLSDIAKRIYSALPPLPLRENDPTTYIQAVKGMLKCSLRHQGSFRKNLSEVVKSEKSFQKYDDAEKEHWSKYFINLSPMQSFSANLSNEVNNSKSESAGLIDLEDIPCSDPDIFLYHVNNANFDDLLSQSVPASDNIADDSPTEYFLNSEKRETNTANLDLNSHNLDIDQGVIEAVPQELSPKHADTESDYDRFVLQAWFQQQKATTPINGRENFGIWHNIDGTDDSDFMASVFQEENTQWMGSHSDRRSKSSLKTPSPPSGSSRNSDENLSFSFDF